MIANDIDPTLRAEVERLRAALERADKAQCGCLGGSIRGDL